MQRVLDLDLDFFADGVAHYRDAGMGRLSAEDYPPWPLEQAMSFLRDRCRLDAARPGAAVEHHREVFTKWQHLIAAGILEVPFHVTHVDAHADLSYGEIGYQYVLTTLVHMPVEQRARAAATRVTSGDYLAHAIGCRWVADVVYVFCPGGGDDVHPYMRENFNRDASALRLSALSTAQVQALLENRTPQVTYDEPRVPLVEVRAADYQGDDSFDFVFLARSPEFTSAAADTLFEAIRSEFINELRA